MRPSRRKILRDQRPEHRHHLHRGLPPGRNRRFNDAAYASLVKLCTWLMGQYGLDETHLIRHYDVTANSVPSISSGMRTRGSASNRMSYPTKRTGRTTKTVCKPPSIDKCRCENPKSLPCFFMRIYAIISAKAGKAFADIFADVREESDAFHPLSRLYRNRSRRRDTQIPHRVESPHREDRRSKRRE